MAHTNLGKAANSLLTSSEINRLLSDDGSDKWGLGTDTPGGTADIQGLSSSPATPILRLGHDGDSHFDFTRSAATGALSIQGTQAGYNNIILAPISGKVGVKKTPDKDFDVDGEIRASTGILFGTDTAAANTLDDYEEGTWSPTIEDSGVAYDAIYAWYTKVGDLVTAHALAENIASTGGGAQIRVGGLPYTNGSYGGIGYAERQYKINRPATAIGSLKLFVAASDSGITLAWDIDDGANLNAVGTDFDDANSTLGFIVQYTV